MPEISGAPSFAFAEFNGDAVCMDGVRDEYIALPLNSTSNPEEFPRNFQVNYKDLSANLATFIYIFLLNYLGTLNAM